MVLVVGATGYIGRYLCLFLKEKGIDVLALGRSKDVQKFFEKNKVNFQYFDINDFNSYKQLPTKNIEAVVDLSACLAEHETPVEKFFEINTLGVYKLLEFCRKNLINKFILTSSHKVYNDVNINFISEDDKISFKGDHSPYIISKVAAENFVEYYNKDFGMNGVCLRLTGVHGYGEILGHLNVDGSYKKSTFEIFVEKAMSGQTIEVWGNQNIKRDHVYIKDVINAILCAIKCKDARGIYNIASGIGYSQYEEAKALAEVFGKDGKKSEVIIISEKQGLERGYVYNVEKAKRELNWEPKYTDLIEMFKDYKYELERKIYHHYYYIKEEEKPITI